MISLPLTLPFVTLDGHRLINGMISRPNGYMHTRADTSASLRRLKRPDAEAPRRRRRAMKVGYIATGRYARADKPFTYGRAKTGHTTLDSYHTASPPMLMRRLAKNGRLHIVSCQASSRTTH